MFGIVIALPSEAKKLLSLLDDRKNSCSQIKKLIAENFVGVKL